MRTAAELRAVIDANPLNAEAKSEPARLLVTFFRTPLDTAAVKAAQTAIHGPEIVRCDGRHLYMFYPNGQADSKAAIVVGATGTPSSSWRRWPAPESILPRWPDPRTLSAGRPRRNGTRSFAEDAQRFAEGASSQVICAAADRVSRAPASGGPLDET